MRLREAAGGAAKYRCAPRTRVLGSPSDPRRQREMAMSTYAKDWGNVWNKCMVPFTKARRGLIPELEDVWKGTGPLVKSLSVLDQNDAGQFKANQLKEKKKALDASLKEFKTLQKEAAKYAKLIDVAIQRTDKVLQKECYRELKVLRAHVDWVENAVNNHLTLQGKEHQKEDAKAIANIRAAEEKLRDEGKGDDEVKVATAFLKYIKLLVAFPTAAKAGGAIALKAIQAIKAEPTQAVYDHEMDHGGRNYTQQINNVIALAKHKDCPADLRTALHGLVGYDAALKEFGGGAKRTAPQGADEKKILELVKEYSQLVKATIGYVDVVGNYVKKNKKALGLK